MADNDEANVADSDSQQSESIESQLSQIHRLSDIAMKRYLEADKLGCRAHPPESFPGAIMHGVIDVLKAEYVIAVETARLRLDDTRAIRRPIPLTLEKSAVMEPACNLANCSLVHTTWYLAARNALGTILLSMEKPLLLQFFNPAFFSNTTEAHIQLNWALPEVDPEIQLTMVLVKIRTITYLDLDFSSFGALPPTIADDLATRMEPPLQTLVIRGVSATDKDALMKFLETPHRTLKTITFVFFDVLEFVDFDATTPNEALIPLSLCQAVQPGALERFNIIDRLPSDVQSSMFQPHIVKLSCGRASSGLFAFDEAAFAVESRSLTHIDDFGKLFLAQVRSLVLECDFPFVRYEESTVKDFIAMTRNLIKLHIRMRGPIETLFGALADLPSTVEELYLSLTNRADELGLDVWDGEMCAGLERIPRGNLKVLYISVSTTFGDVSLPKCEQWCVQKRVRLVAELGGRNLYL